MKVLRPDLDSAVKNEIITSEQAGKLWSHFESLRPDESKFQGLHVLYYFGVVLILASMTWFLSTAWNDGMATMLISGSFALAYLIAGRQLSNKDQFKIAGGLLITAGIALTPVFIYGFEKANGLWSGETPGHRDFHVWLTGGWFLMEIGTAIAALIALRFFKFAFLCFPFVFALWFMSIDITPMLFDGDLYGDNGKLISTIFGIIVLIIAYRVDLKNRKIDYAYWLYLYGLLAFWGGLTLMDSSSEIGKFFYCLINLSIMVKSVYLRRRVFLVFGTMGVMVYLTHLASHVFKDSYGFPVALSCMGLSVLYLGVKYQRNQRRFESLIESRLPDFMLKWRPDER